MGEWIDIETKMQSTLKSGHHVCLLYTTPDYQFQTIANHFKEAIASGRKCIYGCPQDPQIIYQKLKQLGVDVEEVEFYPGERIYLSCGRFDAYKALSFWNGKYKQYEKRGILITAECSFDKKDAKHVHQYELEAHKRISEQNIIAICQYPVKQIHSKFYDLSNSHHYVWADCLTRVELMKRTLVKMSFHFPNQTKNTIEITNAQNQGVLIGAK